MDGCCAQCDGVEEIGVDEHVWRHTPFGSRYVTIIVDLTPRKKGGTARLLDMVEGRSEKAFATWLQERGQAFRERVRVVAMDAFAFGDGVGPAAQGERDQVRVRRTGLWT